MTDSKQPLNELVKDTFDRKAFTLVEVLVVIFTMSLLLALLMPALTKARAQARSLVCRANLRQLVVANIGYAMENDDFYVPAASDMWDDAGLHRWHGTRVTRDESFDPSRGPLTAYLADGHVKDCPARVAFATTANWNDSFEKGCGGYGYNMAYIGSRLWDPRVDFQQAYARTTSTDEVASPGRTVMFADTAMANGEDALIEYSFAEPPFAVLGGQVMTGVYMSPSIHFRHGNRANIAWADGHVGAEPMSSFSGANVYGAHSSSFALGWLEPTNNSPFDLH